MSRLAAGPLPLLGVLLLATALRVWGLAWGLPSQTHYLSYHPDETVVLQAAMGMNAFAGQLLPHFYDYGSLQLYLVNFANSLAFVFGGVNLAIKDLATDWPQWGRMYLIGRSLTVAMGVGTVWATYALGACLWGRRAGLLGAGLLAIMPLHAQHSHWLTVDVPATFWGMLSLVWCAKLGPFANKLGEEIPPAPFAKGGAGTVPVLPFPAPPLQRGRGGFSSAGRPSSALWAGVFAGLATATKYNLALALLPLVVATLVLQRRPGWLGLGLAAAGGAFLLGCPGAVLESGLFLAGIRFEAVHVGNSDDPTFRDTGSGFVYHITRNLDAGLGLPLLLLALASIAYALYRRERADGLLAAFALPYYVLIGLAAVRYARYTIPLLPILALWSGRMLADVSRWRVTVWRRGGLLTGVAITLFTLGDAIWLVGAMAAPDPRDRALAWMTRNAAPPRRVAFAAMPWFGTPPIDPYFPRPRRGGWEQIAPEGLPPPSEWQILYHNRDWDTGGLRADKPNWVILSEYDYADALRVHDPTATQFFGALRSGYSLAASFDRTGLNGLRQDLPHDMTYPSPVISIYQRKP